MANPRQRKKTRSSKYRPVKISKRAQKNHLRKYPAICAPRVVQEAWDRTKTVCQNYAALGLVLRPERAPTEENRKGYGRIVRDENGKVIRVEIEQELEESEMTGVEAKTEVVKALEELPIQPSQHHSSVGEITWLKELVAAHGSDVNAMARDLKLNQWQKTPGQIRQAIKKAGGLLLIV